MNDSDKFQLNALMESGKYEIKRLENNSSYIVIK